MISLCLSLKEGQVKTRTRKKKVSVMIFFKTKTEFKDFFLIPEEEEEMKEEDFEPEDDLLHIRVFQWRTDQNQLFSVPTICSISKSVNYKQLEKKVIVLDFIFLNSPPFISFLWVRWSMQFKDDSFYKLKNLFLISLRYLVEHFLVFLFPLNDKNISLSLGKRRHDRLFFSTLQDDTDEPPNFSKTGNFIRSWRRLPGSSLPFQRGKEHLSDFRMEATSSEICL